MTGDEAEEQGQFQAAGSAPIIALILVGVSSITFYLSFWDLTLGVNLVFDAIRKFACYLSVMVFLNASYYLRELAREIDVETWEFQKDQVRLSLFIVGILIVSELPMWLGALSLD